ncbi:MAG: rod shape-determining protein MreD [Alphaproteobacteria bacterium]|nr:rod shape-determining protein MreD [Alphaproteobacteria bacterium]
MIVSDFRLRLSFWLSKNMPFFFAFLIGFISFFPTAVSLTSVVRPPLIMICVFYFAIYTPNLLSIGKVFLLGFFLDLLSFGPLGIETVTLVFLYALTFSQRKYLFAFSFPLLWFIFSIFSAGFLLLKWLFACLVLEAFTPFIYDAAQWCFLVAFYPFIALICTKIYITSSDDLL